MSKEEEETASKQLKDFVYDRAVCHCGSCIKDHTQSDNHCPVPMLDEDEEQLLKIAARIADLESIVSRLPKTADGVTCSGGEVVFTVYGAERIVLCIEGHQRASDWVAAEPGAIDYDPNCPVSECYSSPAAAEAAREKEKTR